MMIQPVSGMAPSSSFPLAATPSRDPGRVAEGFESMFLNILLEPVEKAGGGFFGEGPEAQILASMFRQQLADQLARSRPLGLANQIEATLRRYEVGRDVAAPDPTSGSAAAPERNQNPGKGNR